MRADALGMFWEDLPTVKAKKPPPIKRTPPARTWEEADYLPGLEEARRFDVQLFTFDEMIRCAGTELLFDIECYENYFLIAFMCFKTGKVAYFEMTPDSPLDIRTLSWVVHNFTLVSFNGIKYDACILALALAGFHNSVLKYATNQIIQLDIRPRDVLAKFKVKSLKLNHIDLIEVAPSVGASLKAYGGRLHVPKMQDLPFHHAKLLSPDQITIVRWYCINDLIGTGFLRHALQADLELRYTLSSDYNIDLRSKSDAQIAEHVISQEVAILNKSRPRTPTILEGTTYKYNAPGFLKFQSATMQWALEVVKGADFVVDYTGSIGMPPVLKELAITIGAGVYRMGIGGLHSSEKSVAHYTDAYNFLEDRDVESFYPRIILNLGLYPSHLGPNFLKVFEVLVNRRIAAKHGGLSRVADSLKIVINGAYGKLGSPYSVMYAPDLMIQVTLTGQLSLLMLIERMEMARIPVVSANTDGIVIKCPRQLSDKMHELIKVWEDDTKFKTEGTNYKAVYSKDVNNYIAIYDKPKKGVLAKTKGVYGATGLKKNPTNAIVSEAVQALLTNRTPIEETIRTCKDIRKFVQVRRVKGGAVKVLGWKPLPDHNSKEELARVAGFTQDFNGNWNLPVKADESMLELSLDSAYAMAKEILKTPDRTQYCGSMLRWYYGKGEEGDMIYASNGHSVPRSQGSKPLMELPKEMPEDVDYDKYVAEAESMLKDLAYY